MEQKGIPKYSGLRIYLISTLLFFFLALPFLGFLAFQSIPELTGEGFLSGGGTLMTDSMRVEVVDSIVQKALNEGMDPETAEMVDSILQEALNDRANPETAGHIDSIIGNVTGSRREYQLPDSAVAPAIVAEAEATTGSGNNLHIGGVQEGGPFSQYFRIFFITLLVAYLAGFIYNRPFKRYFRRKRKGRQVREKLHAWCKKQLLATPVFNSLIVIMPNIAVILYSLFIIFRQDSSHGEIERDLFIQFFILSVVATLLEYLFVYYWQKHRVHIRYIEHIYSREELRRQVFRRKRGKIRDRLLIASGMTTFFPLLVVMVYLILSISSVKELELDSLSPEQREILMGQWNRVFQAGEEYYQTRKYDQLFYVNAIDSVIMLVGIGTGITVSFIYIFLFIRWTNRDITRPVKELLSSMRRTRGGEAENYTVVRTNDEIGELAEGYNEMTEKINDYVESISRMNRDLEKRVLERTEEVLFQKEEIEAQKEEIETQKEEMEAQLELTTIQRDTITRQKDLILDSIRYARRIQSALLPPGYYLADVVKDHFILFRPRDIVSGDYYWATFHHGKLLVAVADCTGHGVPGAFLSMLGISSMNEIINRSGDIHASDFLEQLRDIIIHTLHQTGTKGEARDGLEISLCIYDPVAVTLEFAGANQSLYLIRGENGEVPPGNEAGHLIQYRGDRMPIGIYEHDPLPFTHQEVPIRKNDSIYLFSDGYVDQLGGAGRKTFRARRFRELLLEISSYPMEQQKKLLDENLERWRGEVEQIDDILVMGLRF